MKVLRKSLALGALLVAVGVVFAQPPQESFPARIQRWIDGDTAFIRVLGSTPSGVGNYETIRLLGINTPELGEPWAEEATRLFRTLTMGKTVYVELSPWERRDIYSRLLAYLWVETGKGWVMVNEELLAAGFARLLVYYPERERYYCRFLRAVALAQTEGRGLWESARTPLELEKIEADPVQYVTTAVAVILEVSHVELDQLGWSLWANASRYGFRVVVQPQLCWNAWDPEDFDPTVLVGQRIVVTGELLWDSLRGGPRVVVWFPEQIRLCEDKQ